jgi:hypothetical protein
MENFQNVRQSHLNSPRPLGWTDSLNFWNLKEVSTKSLRLAISADTLSEVCGRWLDVFQEQVEAAREEVGRELPRLRLGSVGSYSFPPSF